MKSFPGIIIGIFFTVGALAAEPTEEQRKQSIKWFQSQSGFNYRTPVFAKKKTLVFSSRARISDEAIKHLIAFPELERLEIYTSRIGVKGYGYLRRYPKLRVLHLGPGVPLKKVALQVAALRQLDELSIRNKACGDEIIKTISTLGQLRQLILYPCVKATDAAVGYISRMQSLRFINLEYSKVTNAVLPALCKLPRLISLNLAGSSVGGPGFEAIRKCKQLEFLKLRGITFHDADIESLSKLPRLKNLTLNSLKKKYDLNLNRNISQAGFRKLIHFTALERLDLSRSGITRETLMALVKLKSLKMLYIRNSPFLIDVYVRRFRYLRPDVTVHW